MNHVGNDFTSRMQQILIYLLQREGAMPVKMLAEQMGISKRTVQRELQSVEHTLKKYGITFCSKVGSGIWLEGSAEDKAALLAVLQTENTLDVADRQKRRKQLILEILKEKSVKKLYYYAALFGVSETTVSADLEAVEDWLDGFELHVVRKPGMGISIEGSETDFRRALRAFIDENMNTSLIQRLYREPEDETCISQVISLARDKSEKNIYRILDEKTVRRVIYCTRKVSSKKLRNLTERSYTNLVIHITIAVKRIMEHELIEPNPQFLAGVKRDEDFLLADAIMKELEQEFDISIPEEETAYICLHIKGTKAQKYEVDHHSAEQILEYREVLEAVNEMIDRYDPEMAFALKQDEEFVVQGLAAHLLPTLVRLRNHMKIQNPLLEYIKKEYGEIYERCLDVAKVIEERFGCEVPDTEVGFLAVHFGAAMMRLENRKESKRKVRIGVVCASGIGISRLMVSKMKCHFMERVEITAFGTCDLNPYALEHLDFLMSTIQIQEEIETLMVSPLLTENEMEQIEKRVRFYERMPEKVKEKNEFTRKLKTLNHMAVEIRSMIQEMRYQFLDPSVTFEEMLDEISQMLTPHQDQQQIIYQDLKLREIIGSQIIPEFEIALLHAKTKGVTKTSFSVCRAKECVPFSDSYFKGIGTVIVMMMPDDEHWSENREILGFLSETLVKEEEFLETILRGTREEIQGMLSKYLKQYFGQYLNRV